MQPFLQQYAKQYLSKPKERNKNDIIILPSKRAVVALKKQFAAQQKYLWLPEIIDIVSFIEKISELKILSKEEILLDFYTLYANLKKGKKQNSFENFYGWASILIADFNDLDRCLVNTKDFFEQNKAYKQLHYFGVKKTKLIKSYLAFWDAIPEYYYALKKHLLKHKTAYQGLAYRIAVMQLEDFLKKSKDIKLNFVGFNALNKAEEYIIERCLIDNKAKIVWDIDKAFLKDKSHPASIFIHKYKSKWSTHQKLFEDIIVDEFENPKKIKIISSPKQIGQTKAVANILNQLQNKDHHRTAIILNDENLLNPILNSLPSNIKDYNITMGIPLGKSPISSFFGKLFEIQLIPTNYISTPIVKSILLHKLIETNMFKEKKKLKSNILQQKKRYLSFESLSITAINDLPTKTLQQCLLKQKEPKQFIHNTLSIIDILIVEQTQLKPYIIAYQTIFKNLLLITQKTPKLSIKALQLLYKENEKNTKLSFQGSSEKGIQIMGLLETRLLDFDTVILTSLNEAILPAGKSDNSFITYTHKKKFGIPTHSDKDAVYAYHFFRLLQRAKNCFFIYDSDQSGFNKGESSRFLSYLKIFGSPKHHLTEESFSLPTKLQFKQKVEIIKSPEIMKILINLANSGFSPTALSTYILNPLLFYKRYILKIKETESQDKVITHKEFGTVVHNTLEILYKNTTQLTKKVLKKIDKDYEKILQREFLKFHDKDSIEVGANRVQYELAIAYIQKFLQKDLQSINQNPVQILEIEKSVQAKYKIDNQEVKLYGKIDRLDRVGDTHRIIDYKTSYVDDKHLRFNDFEKLIKDYDYSKAFQVLFYALVYSKQNKQNNFQAGIISFRNLKKWFMPVNYNKQTNLENSIIDIFEEYLLQLISEILNPIIPFVEKDTKFL